MNKLKALADEKASILLINPSGQMATKQTIIEAGHTSDALQYELEDMETAILTGNTAIMKLRESSDVMDIMTKLRSDWGLSQATALGARMGSGTFFFILFQTADRICQICYNEVYDYSRLRLFRPAIRCAARTRIHS